jgi:hemerythrin-like metal-binding protein
MIKGYLMATIEWDVNLELGIAHIDEQHKSLVAILNELNSLSNLDELKAIVMRLVTYAVEHFVSEDNYMWFKDDPNRAMHNEEHKDFQRKVQAFAIRVIEGEYNLAPELSEFVHFWLYNHIATVDTTLKRL